jgi:hypothetical protein
MAGVRPTGVASRPESTPDSPDPGVAPAVVPEAGEDPAAARERAP